MGGGGGGLGSLGISLDSAFGKYVGSLRKVGLDVAIVVDATGSMQNVIDELKHRLDDLVFTMQRLVPTARIGAVAYRDRDDGKIATAPRQSEDFLVKWTDLTFNGKQGAGLPRRHRRRGRRRLGGGGEGRLRGRHEAAQVARRTRRR